MEDCRDSYRVIFLFDFIDDTIGKTIRVAPTNVFCRVAATIEKRIFCKTIPNVDYLLHELCT